MLQRHLLNLFELLIANSNLLLFLFQDVDVIFLQLHEAFLIQKEGSLLFRAVEILNLHRIENQLVFAALPQNLQIILLLAAAAAAVELVPVLLHFESSQFFPSILAFLNRRRTHQYRL